MAPPQSPDPPTSGPAVQPAPPPRAADPSPSVRMGPLAAYMEPLRSPFRRRQGP